MDTLLTTLCIVHNHPKVLLAMKKRGFGKGRWNGFGGKLEPGESIEEAVIRECKEEGNIQIKDFTKIAILDFEFTTGITPIECHVFKALSFDGEPEETEEMSPAWFSIDEIPFSEMWPDDKLWFPHFLQNEKFRGRFVFGEGDVMLEHSINLTPSLS